MMICGGLFVFTMKNTCEEEKSMVVGIEREGTNFGCTITCGSE